MTDASGPRAHAAIPVDRRALLRVVGGGGVLALAAPLLADCSAGGSAGTGATGSDVATTLRVPVASVPVGGGVIVEGTVVVQPTAGKFLAFDGTCPHQGCTVNKIEGTLVICPCHGSRFSVADGSVRHGPAQQGLVKRSVTVDGTQIVVG